MALSKKIPVLIVEDNPFNIRAAKAYFRGRRDLEVHYARTYYGGKGLLEKHVIGYAIFDLHIPIWWWWGKAFEHGRILAALAKEQRVEWAIMTAGPYHSAENVAHVHYNWDRDDPFEYVHVSHNEITKAHREAWQKVFEELEKRNPTIGQVLSARRRARK